MEVVSNVSSVDEKARKTALFFACGRDFFSLAAKAGVRTSPHPKTSFWCNACQGAKKVLSTFLDSKPLTCRARAYQVALAQFGMREAVEERACARELNAPPHGGANARRVVAGANAAPRAAKTAVGFCD